MTEKSDLGHLGFEESGCSPEDIAFKTFFLGPQAENAVWLKELVNEILENWFTWRREGYPEDGHAISGPNQRLKAFKEKQQVFREATRTLLNRFEGEIPKYSPRYLGHMFSEISLPALLGHWICALHNPNLISSESARVGVQIEQEAIDALVEMFKMDPQAAMGHFTADGTIANFEALVRARDRFRRWATLALFLEKETGNPHSAAMGWDQFNAWIASLSESQKKRLNDSSSIEMQEIQDRVDERWRKAWVLVPQSRHYSWDKAVRLFGFSKTCLKKIPLTEFGRVNVSKLEEIVKDASVGPNGFKPDLLMVVSVFGSTELGSIDPISEIQELCGRQHLWHHVDAAYGGFFACLGAQAEGLFDQTSVKAMLALNEVNSITVDPHKLAYVPYATGTFVVRDRKDYWVETDESPYIQYDKKRVIDRGPYTLEGSRSGTGPAATWLTSKSIGFHAEGFGRIVARTIRMKLKLQELLEKELPKFRACPGLHSNLLCFVLAETGEPLSATESRMQRVLESVVYRPKTMGRGLGPTLGHELDSQPVAEAPFFFSQTRIKREVYGPLFERFCESWRATVPHLISDEGFEKGPSIQVARLCLMNPFFDSVELNEIFSERLVAHLRQF